MLYTFAPEFFSKEPQELFKLLQAYRIKAISIINSEIDKLFLKKSSSKRANLQDCKKKERIFFNFINSYIESPQAALNNRWKIHDGRKSCK